MPRKGRDAMQFPEEKLYTIEDIYALPDDKRGELIDGKLYMMAPPSRIHQKIQLIDITDSLDTEPEWSCSLNIDNACR